MAEADTLVIAFEDAFARLRGRIEAVCADRKQCGWPVRTAAGVEAAFAFAASDLDAARVLTRETLTGGPECQARHQEMIAYFAGLLCSAREAGANPIGWSDVNDNATAGGVALLVGRRLADGRESELPSAAREAAQFVLTPWVGIERARRIASEHCRVDI